MRAECFETFFFFIEKVYFFHFFCVFLRFRGFAAPFDIIPSQLTARTECRANDRTDEKQNSTCVQSISDIHRAQREGARRHERKNENSFRFSEHLGRFIGFLCLRWPHFQMNSKFHAFFCFFSLFISFNGVFSSLCPPPPARSLRRPFICFQFLCFVQIANRLCDVGALRLSAHYLIRCDNDRRCSIDCTFRVDENWESPASEFARFECSRERKGTIREKKKEFQFSASLCSALLNVNLWKFLRMKYSKLVDNLRPQPFPFSCVRLPIGKFIVSLLREPVRRQRRVKRTHTTRKNRLKSAAETAANWNISRFIMKLI